MATIRGSGRGRPGLAAKTTSEIPGVEPLGTVRRSQLITTYGIGAIVDLEAGSFMPTGLEDWANATRFASLSISEPRLEGQLGVSHFRSAPDHGGNTEFVRHGQLEKDHACRPVP